MRGYVKFEVGGTGSWTGLSKRSWCYIFLAKRSFMNWIQLTYIVLFLGKNSTSFFLVEKYYNDACYEGPCKALVSSPSSSFDTNMGLAKAIG